MANTRRIGVQLDFTANMSQAKQAVNEFKQSLTNVMTTLPSNKMTSTAVNSLKEAQVAAQQLDLALTRAFNKNTGNINITKFSQSLKSSGTDIKQLSNSLLNAGKVGQQSFLAMARALQQVERSAITVNGLTQRLVITLWNNVRWQVTSAAINSVTTSISDAVNHLKDMDNALNAIRVVSGATKVEMQGVANEARRMAKDLKTSATEIVKAELIYRQQGDSAELAAKKAEITTKAANVSFNSSAEQMSEYLTAIWNSYQVPEDQLELFVDKIAKIGAETATSMEEIATAMQKVASTANNVGVSYDQLAAVIATVSSTTRQSAEIVGTSFRTIFARIEDLKLGKTTEDGVVLGNVSSDLEKMGISIYDTQGELKQLGDVLEEMGAKWQTMSKEEQVALAQTVGGKRQYSMLMALMDNWDMYSETVKEAANAYGTLDEQQNIWAESWEAHAQQVQVSAERLYDTLLKSDSVLTAMNGFSWFLERIADATDAAGGLGNILLWIGTIMVSRLTPQIMNSINSIASGYDIISGKAHKREVELQNELTAQLQQIQASQAYTGQQKLEAGFLAENAQQKQKILKIEQNLSDQQKEKLNSLISVKNGWQEIALQEQEAIDKSKEYLKDFNFTKATGKYKINKDASIGFLNQGKQYGNGKTLTKTNLARVATEGIQSVYGGGVSYADLAAEIGIAKKEVEKLRSVTNKKEYFAGLLQKIGIIKPELQDLSSEAKRMIASFEDKNVNFSKISQALNQLQVENGETVLSTEQINAKFAECGIEVNKLPPKIQEYIQELNGAQFSEEKFQKAVTEANNELIKEIISLTDNTEEGAKLEKILKDLATGKRNLTKATQEEIEAQKRLNAETKKAAQQNAAVQSLTAITSTAMTAFMTINQVESAINNFNNGQLTEGWTNIIFSLMNIGSLIPTIKAVKVALVEAGLTAGAAWGWIAVVGVAIAGLVAIVKYFENNSLHAYTEELKETQDNISNIKSEITQIDEKTKALEEKGANITDQEYETLQMLRQQKLEKQALLNLEQDKEKESIGNTISKATKGSGFFEGQFKNILKPIEVYSGDASAYHQFFSMKELEKVRSQSNSIFEWAKRAKTDIEQSKQKVSKDNVSLPAKYNKEGNLIESARSTETILQDLEQQEKQIEKIEKNAEKNRKLWRARIKENYDEISKLNYIEGDNLTSTEKEFNKLKESTIIDYFISLSEEATKATMTNISRSG